MAQLRAIRVVAGMRAVRTATYATVRDRASGNALPCVFNTRDETLQGMRRDNRHEEDELNIPIAASTFCIAADMTIRDPGQRKHRLISKSCRARAINRPCGDKGCDNQSAEAFSVT